MIYDLIGLFLVLTLWALVCFVGHGYPNTVDAIALWLHRHAMDCRQRHARRTATVQEQWVRQIEVEEYK